MPILGKFFGPPNIEKLKAKRDIKGLVKAFRDKPYVYDRQAVIALGELGNPTAVDPLLALLEDKTRSNLHSHVARALGKLGDVRAIQPLIKELDSQGMLAEAAEALGELGDRRAIEPLVAQLGRGWPDANVQIALALAKLGTESLEPLLAALRDGKSRNTRECAAMALGLLRDGRAVEPLITALDDNDQMVYQAAAKALGVIGDPRAIAPLISRLGRHLPRFAIALVRIGGDEAEQAVFDYWLTNPYEPSHWPEETALAIISRAERMSDSRAAEALTIRLKDNRNTVREAAAAALKHIRGGT
jgi:HEAT repeat protein